MAKMRVDMRFVEHDSWTGIPFNLKNGPQALLWIAKLERNQVFPLGLDSYLDLVDATRSHRAR